MSIPFRVGFCVSGHGHLFRSAVQHAAQIGIQPALLLAGAHAAEDLEDICRASNIPFVRLYKMQRAELDMRITEVCTQGELDLLSLTFDKILPVTLVAHFNGRIINVHPALLPAFPGLRAFDQAIGRDVRFAGATIHVVDEEVDHGPIIAQCILSVRRSESARQFGARLFPYLRLMYLQVLTWYAERRIVNEEDRVRVKDGTYGEFPINPAVENAFSD